MFVRLCRAFDVSCDVFLHAMEYGSVCHTAVKSKITRAKVSAHYYSSSLTATNP
jgi:hypothetical protein